MEYVKFTFVKLNILCLAVISSMHLFFAEDGMAKQMFAVQIAASKTPLDIQKFAKKNNITDSIFVLESESWVRYCIGSFENSDSASALAQKLLRTTSLSKVFVRVINDSSNDEKFAVLRDSSNVPDILPGVTDIKYSFENGSMNNNEEIQHKASENFILRLLLNEKEISNIKEKLSAYGNRFIPDPLRGFYQFTVESSFYYSGVLIVIALIIFFILNLIGVFFVLNYSIRKKNRKEKFLKIYGIMYEKVLMSYIFGEIDWEMATFNLKKKEKKENRKLLISILLTFKQNFRGDLEKLIPEIYMKLDLQKDSLKSAYSKRSHTKVQGIIELTHLYSQGAKEIIPQLINHPNDYVRSEAQKAFIRLNPEEPFKFFETLSRPFTRWTQLSAFHTLRLYQLPVPSFSGYLKSNHPNIIRFSLRMIVYFQQFENVSAILKMLDSKDELTRFFSYRAIDDLRIYQAKEAIKNKYPYETGKNKYEIVKIFKNIGDENDFEFLEMVLFSKTVSLKTEACRSMYFMSGKGKERLIDLKNESFPEIEQILTHVTDSRN